jgi:hypothetical protein
MSSREDGDCHAWLAISAPVLQKSGFKGLISTPPDYSRELLSLIWMMLLEFGTNPCWVVAGIRPFFDCFFDKRLSGWKGGVLTFARIGTLQQRRLSKRGWKFYVAQTTAEGSEWSALQLCISYGARVSSVRLNDFIYRLVH